MVFRVHGEDMMFGSSVHPVPPRIPQVKMMKVHIPFTFKLVESSKSSYSGELSYHPFRCVLYSISRRYCMFARMSNLSSVTELFENCSKTI